MYTRVNLHLMMAITLIVFHLIFPAQPGEGASFSDSAHCSHELTMALSSHGFPDAGSTGNHSECCCEVSHNYLGAPSGNETSDYSPLITMHSFRDPAWHLPQVIRPIFVPPQNSA